MFINKKNTSIVNIDIINIDKNYEEFIKTKLIKEYKNKCTNLGFIRSIKNISILNQGDINEGDLSGSVNFLVNMNLDSFDFKIGDIIKCEVQKIDKELDIIFSIKIITEDEYLIPCIIFILQNKNHKISVNDIINVKINAIKIDLIENKFHLIAEIVK